MDGLILAAGLSSRMKNWKMSLLLNGKEIIIHTAENMLSVCDRVFIVGGYNFDLLRKIFEKYSLGNVKLIFNENFEKGEMFSSVKKGIGVVESDYFFLVPGDMPLIKQDIYRKLINENSGEKMVIVPSYDFRKGHPVLINTLLKKDILNEPVESNLKKVLIKYEHQFVNIDSPVILMDIDTNEDFHKIQKFIGEGE